MEELISLFKENTGETPECIKIKGEGSNRQYYRLKSKSISLIGVKGENVTENKTFIYLSNHFAKKNLNTPKVVASSSDGLFYLQEDLGDISLFQFIKNGIETGYFNTQEIEMLFRTVSLLPDIQFKGAEGLDFSVCYPIPEMDKRSILWDLNYFKYCFLKGTKIDFSEVELENDFERLSNRLLETESNTFLYRDFQSRNVMIHNGQPYFIDFQGGRKGPIFYDLASFAWQAKANFSEKLRDELVSVYIESVRKYIEIDEQSFRQNLQIFVLFRTLQVLGAYGYRGLFERKPHFIESIPFAINNLSGLINDNDYSEFPYLIKILKQITSLDTFKKKELPDPEKLKVSVYSFSYKKGIPADESGNGGGYVFDCRGVHNPGRYEEYKKITGIDQPVIDFLEKDGEITKFLEHVYALADAHVLRYMERGFTSLQFSFGCTGGQHRSVYSAQHVAEHISKKFGVEVHLCHREQGINQVLPVSKSM